MAKDNGFTRLNGSTLLDGYRRDNVSGRIVAAIDDGTFPHIVVSTIQRKPLVKGGEPALVTEASQLDEPLKVHLARSVC